MQTIYPILPYLAIWKDFVRRCASAVAAGRLPLRSAQSIFQCMAAIVRQCCKVPCSRMAHMYSRPRLTARCHLRLSGLEQELDGRAVKQRAYMETIYRVLGGLLDGGATLLYDRQAPESVLPSIVDSFFATGTNGRYPFAGVWDSSYVLLAPCVADSTLRS